MSDDTQLNTQLTLINMIQALDRKLQCVENCLGEMNSSFNDFTQDISCRFESLNPQLNNIENILLTKPARGERRVSFCEQTKSDYEKERQAPEKENQAPPPPVENMLLKTAVKKWKSKSFHKPKSYLSYASQEYSVKRVDKSENDKIIINDVIKSSSYYKFSMCCYDEMTDLVDAFGVESFSSGSLIVNQGDAFERFYIVKSGMVDVLVDGAYVSSLASKEAFESSFMMGSTSISTFRARDDCEIWFLAVEEFRRISIHYKRMRSTFKTNFLKTVSLTSHYVCHI